MSDTIREYIERDLAERLQTGQATSADLTLQALANHYGVSFTPVRQAIQALIGNGLIAKQDNGRLDARAQPSKRRKPVSTTTPLGVPSRSADLEVALTEEVLRASLRGDTDYLREEATARKLGVGRTAIRQVFGRLGGKGFLVHVPRCGWKVRLFDFSDLAAYIVIREVLELKALELARPKLAKDDLKRMLAGNTGGRDKLEIDNEIHGYLIAKSENSYIRDFFERNGAFYTTLFDFAAPETKVVSRMASQHRLILQALIAEDWEGARMALIEHIRAQRPVVEELMRKVSQAPLLSTQLESA